MPPADPLGLVTNLVTLAQLLRGLLADAAARRAVLAGTERAAADHFGEDARFVTTEILEREATARVLLAPPSAGRHDELNAQFRDAFAEQPDRVTGRERLGERVAAFMSDVDELLLEHGVHEAQALGRKIEAARSDLRRDIVGSESRVLQGQEQLQAGLDRQEVSAAEILREVRALKNPDAEVEAQFEALRGVAGRGRVEVATEEALELRGGLRPDAPAELRARFGRFIGTGLLALAETERAVEELERALADSPDDPDLKLNAAGANLLVGRFQRAHDLAHQAFMGGKRDDALGVLVQTTYWLQGTGAAEAFARDHDAAAGAATALGLSFVFQREGRYAEAEALLRPHLPDAVATVGDAQTYSELAGALVGGALQTLRAEQLVPWLQPAAITAALDEAEAHLTAAISFMERTDYRTQLARDLANRGLVRNLFWHDARALGDHRRALELDPNARQSRLNLARYHLTQDEFDAAADVLSTIPDDKRSYEVHRLLGEALHLAGRSGEALPFLEAAVEQADGDEELVPILAFLLDAHRAEGDLEALASLEAQLEATAPDDPDALAARAHAAFRRGDLETMVSLYERALAQPGGHHAIRLDYANRLYRLERWQQAAEQYTQVVTPDAFEATTRHYAVALLKAGRRKDALEFSRAVRERHGVRLGVTEVEAHVLRWVSDTKACLELWKALHTLVPDNLSIKLGLAEVLVLSRDFDDARGVVERVDWRGLGQAEDVMRLAQLRQMLGLPEALLIAWEALRSAPNDPEVHRHFTSLAFQWNGDASPADFDVVVPNSVVMLERGDGTAFSVSILEGRNDLREGEVTPDSPQARRLLGQRVQREVEWGQQLLGRRTVTIQSVTPVLVHAVRDSLAGFGERFPDHAGPVMFRGESPQEAATTLVQVLTGMEEAARPLVERCLSDPRLPLHLLAHKVLGMPFHQLRIWARGASGRHLHAFDGEPRQAYRKRVRVQSAKRIVIDDSALLTLAELDLLDTLTERFEEVIVPTSMLLELDGMVMQHTGRLEPEAVPAELSLALRVRDWVLEHATPMPVYARLNLDPEVLARTEDVLGDATADALALAQELEAPLFSDDLGLNLMTEGEWRVRPTDTLQHLQELHARKRLSFDAYVKQLSILSRWRYSFIGVSANTLLQAFRADPHGADFPQLISELASPRAYVTSALDVGADTILLLLDVKDVDYRLCMRAIRTVLDALAKRTEARAVALHMVRRVLLRRLDEPAAQSLYVEVFRKVLWNWVARRGLLNEPAELVAPV